MKFTTEYTYTNPFGNPNHTWLVVGARMAVHLHITDSGEEHGAKCGGRYSGGIESHYRSPPSHMQDDAPSQKKCWALGGPCWHDGSSLQASEHWIPFWICEPNDHERMFRALEVELEDRDRGEHRPTTLEIVDAIKDSAEGVSL